MVPRSVILARCRYARTTTAAGWGAYAAGVDGGIKSWTRVTAGADNGPRSAPIRIRYQKKYLLYGYAESTKRRVQGIAAFERSSPFQNLAWGEGPSRRDSVLGGLDFYGELHRFLNSEIDSHCRKSGDKTQNKSTWLGEVTALNPVFLCSEAFGAKSLVN